MELTINNLLQLLTALTGEDQIKLLDNFLLNCNKKDELIKFIAKIEYLIQLNNKMNSDYPIQLNELIKKTRQKIKELQ